MAGWLAGWLAASLLGCLAVFEDLGLEGAGGLGWPWLAGLVFEDPGLGFEDLALQGRPALEPQPQILEP